MAIDNQHLREIAQNAFTLVNGGIATAVGGVVPANKKRYIYFLKLVTISIAVDNVYLWRNGAAGTIPFDSCRIPGVGAGFIGMPYLVLGSDIDFPIYILGPGEQLGVTMSPAVNYAFISFYDEE